MTNTSGPIYEPTTDPLRFLRRHYSAVITIDELIVPRNIVIDPASGELVAALPASVDDAESIVLHVPDESSGSLQMMVECRPLDANRDAACDRLLIYHGRAEGARFAAMHPIDVKWEVQETKIENFFGPSPLASEEPRLCRMLNGDPNALGALLERLSGRATMEPRAVGVDQLGLDVRTRTGLVRIEFREPLTPQTALATIEEWMRKS
ncbi:MAG: hypothetical protein KF805_11625 [Phycisphaeraceae bacterium]|nr:hypothetical protein [Phycisphaeraceae bacterium]